MPINHSPNNSRSISEGGMNLYSIIESRGKPIEESDLEIKE